MLSPVKLFCATLWLCLLSSIWVAAQTEAPDAGLVTDLNGDASFYSGEDHKKAMPVQRFMKVHLSDHFNLPGGSSLQLLYFASGRQENWKGPVALTVGEAESRAEGATQPLPQPEVKVIPVRAAKRMGTASLPVPSSSSQVSGGIQTMAPQKSSGKGVAPVEGGAEPAGMDDPNDIAAARMVYDDWRKSAPARDLTPEFYLLGVLADHQQFKEMERTLDGMLKKKPGDPVLKDLKAWVRLQSARRSQGAPASRKK